MITSIEARVAANGALHGVLHFEGDQKDIVKKFIKPGSDAHAQEIISGITKQPETVIVFNEMPGRRGVNDIHELIVDHGTNGFAQTEWIGKIYPTLAGRLGLT